MHSLLSYPCATLFLLFLFPFSLSFSLLSLSSLWPILIFPYIPHHHFSSLSSSVLSFSVIFTDSLIISFPCLFLVFSRPVLRLSFVVCFNVYPFSSSPVTLVSLCLSFIFCLIFIYFYSHSIFSGCLFLILYLFFYLFFFSLCLSFISSFISYLLPSTLTLVFSPSSSSSLSTFYSHTSFSRCRCLCLSLALPCTPLPFPHVLPAPSRPPRCRPS